MAPRRKANRASANAQRNTPQARRNNGNGAGQLQMGTAPYQAEKNALDVCDLLRKSSRRAVAPSVSLHLGVEDGVPMWGAHRHSLPRH